MPPFGALVKPGVRIINENLNLSLLCAMGTSSYSYATEAWKYFFIYIFSLSLVIKSTIFLIHTSRNITAAPPAAMII